VHGERGQLLIEEIGDIYVKIGVKLLPFQAPEEGRIVVSDHGVE
jgi:hypothetical protein